MKEPLPETAIRVRQGYGLSAALRSSIRKADITTSQTGRGLSNIKPKYLESDASRNRWLVSYTDLLTLLLIFFVAASAKSLNRPQLSPSLKSHAVEDKVRITSVSAAAPVQPQPEPSQTPLPTHQGLVRAQQELEKLGLSATMEARGLVISLPQAILFASGKDQVSTAALPVVGSIAGVIRDIPNRVSLAGHADAIPIHNREFQNNWELASARGMRLLQLFSQQYGIPETRLSVASFGSNDPKEPNDTEAGRATNRRVEIVIQDETATP